MSNALTAGKGAIFVQRKGPGTQPEYVGCADVDDISMPPGDITPIYCSDETGKLKTVGRSRSTPGRVTASITSLVFAEPSVLDELTNCPVNLFFQTWGCGRADEFAKAVRGTAVHNALITNATESNIVKREADDARTYKLDFSGDYPWERYRLVKGANVGGSPDAVLTDIAFLGGQCESDCGEFKENCNDGVAIGYAAGSASTPVVYITHDAGVTWSAAAALPFAAGGAAEQVAALLSVAYFHIGNVDRILVARGTAAATKDAVAYSDDDGATWTIVSLTDSIAGDGAVGTESLYAMDAYHIWYVNDGGYIFFSEDGGATWTLYDAGVASSGAALNGIHFADKSNGFAVGPAGLVIASTDGGVTWTAMTATGAGALYGIHAFTKNRVIVGGATVGLWISYDGGVTWNARAVTGGSGTIDDIMFLNDLVGYAVVGDDIARSVDGGYTWELYALGSFVGSAVWVCDVNTAFVVGATSGGEPSIVKVN